MINKIMTSGKAISGLSSELESRLKEIAPVITPHLPKVTDAFYVKLLTTSDTFYFLKAHSERIEHLKTTHLNWLNSLFTQDIDADFTEKMLNVGDAHVAIQLPLEFMTGSMYLMSKELFAIVIEEFGDDKQQCTTALQAINAVLGFSLIVMQKSYALWA
ncbi:hypothetical protein KFZ76_05200 [Methylovulum psychrotolerans]|uniref:protoglobin domain-containing protein n=1 Tax=Methylovulum psychrotolerans TaxID=1704499 RepID=UPI001BFFD1C0|nr:protoglobin domain-containing protein [Methylovulum psychrotolerans]MBT9097106.1 hypothetical protein [Methylovulum psychrotolerans]